MGNISYNHQTCINIYVSESLSPYIYDNNLIKTNGSFIQAINNQQEKNQNTYFKIQVFVKKLFFVKAMAMFFNLFISFDHRQLKSNFNEVANIKFSRRYMLII